MTFTKILTLICALTAMSVAEPAAIEKTADQALFDYLYAQLRIDKKDTLKIATQHEISVDGYTFQYNPKKSMPQTGETVGLPLVEMNPETKECEVIWKKAITDKAGVIITRVPEPEIAIFTFEKH